MWLITQGKRDSMKKISVLLMLFGALVIVGQVHAGLMDRMKTALPGVASTPVAGGEVKSQDFETIHNLFSEADGLLQNSVANLVAMVCNKDISDELNRKMQAAREIKDPKEREAAIGKVKESQTVALLEASENKETAGKLSKLSDEQKKLASNSLYNFVLAGLKDKTVVELANGVVSKVQANPSAAISYSKDISRTKDIATTLPSQVSKIVQVSDNLIKLAKTSKIEVVIPQTSSDPAREVAI